MAADWRRAAEDHADATPAVRAWAAGWAAQATGRYGQALDLLDEAEADGAALTLAAALATRAALLRQVGLHERAEEADEHGRRALTGVPPSPARDDVAAGLAIGAVADDVGRGDRAAQWERLDAAAVAVERAGERQRLRLGWVVGEVALVHDDPGGATRALAAAAERAGRAGWPRHEAKSLVFLTAAETLIGEREAALEHARRGLALAEQSDARPLVWPGLLVLALLVTGAEAAGHRRAAARELDALLRGLPAELEAEARAAPSARSLLG